MAFKDALNILRSIYNYKKTFNYLTRVWSPFKVDIFMEK